MRLFSFLLTLVRRGAFGAAGAVALLTSGCSWQTLLGLNGKQSTFDIEGPVARDQLDLFYVTCWVTLVLFVVVGGVLAYATLKFKARTEADEHAEVPPQGHGNPLVEVGLIGGAILALVIIAFPTLRSIHYTYDVP